MIKLKPVFLPIAGLCISLDAFAQSLSDFSLEELMDVNVKVTTDSNKNLRNAPGIVSVVDEKQIRAMGARNLLDILNSIPGITIGHDVQGNLSVIMRGIWAQEGRVLLVIDGIEMNDRSYGTLQLGNHFPATQIKKIEIIRGPGSAIYGGIAELGVINIITKDGEELSGLEANGSFGRTNADWSSMMTNFMIGQKKEDLQFALGGMYTNGNFSDRNYTDENGATANLGDGNSGITNKYLNFKSSYKNFYFNYIKDGYKSENIVLWGDLENTPGTGDIRKPVPKLFPTDAYLVGYKGQISEKVQINTYFLDKVQYPYFQPDTTNEVAFTNSWRRKTRRQVIGLRTQYQLNERHSLHIGGENSKDKSWVLNRVTYSGTPDTFGDGSQTSSIENTALFGQYDLTSDFINLTAGLRYDDNSESTNTLVPRMGLTKVFGKSHFKALYAKAFRSPMIENVSLNKYIKPEITTTSEIEFGHQFTPSLNWTLNLFSTRVKDPIIYSYDASTNLENYDNYDHVKVVGLETEFTYLKGIHFGKMNLSTYQIDSLESDPYRSNVDNKALLGAPRLKFFLMDSLALAEDFTLTPSLVFLGDNNGAGWDETSSSFKQQRLPDQWIGNIFARFSNVLTNGLGAGLGVNNIMNTNVYFSQPYQRTGDYRAGPYPGRSREYVVMVDYKQNF